MKPVIIIAIAVVCSVVIFSNLSDAEAKTWKVYLSEMPKHWESQFGNIYYDGTTYWEKRVPGTYFIEIDQREKADFVVQWSSQFQGNKLGYYTTSTNNDFGRPFIAITLGFMDDESVKWQDRKFNLVDAEYAKLITIHELGHAIGFGHSDNPDDIMYASIYNYDSWLSEKQLENLETNQKSSVNIEKLQNTEPEQIVCPQGFEPVNGVCPDKPVILQEPPLEIIEQRIPWTKNIIGWYAQGEISEDELLEAIQYLIDEGILVVD
jgi:hypothetical protein